MTLTPEVLAQTWDFLPNPQTISFEQITGPGNSFASAVTIPRVQKRQSTEADLSGSQLTTADETVTFLIWKSQMPSGTGRPYQGSKITHDGETWIVERCMTELMGQVYRVVTTLSAAANV
jgi:hypothetical protein